MPRDKSISHDRVVKAAASEFLEKGFENASMRSIGEKAGMTPAGLYRHYASKEDMFDALVAPAITASKDWYIAHKAKGYAEIDNNATKSELFSSTMIDFMRDIVYPNEVAFRLLLTKAQGTKHQNFVHRIIEVQQDDMLDVLEYMRKRGVKVKEVSREEMHMIISAYTTALLEPFVHNMDKASTMHCLETIEDFFMPGWMKIMGY